MRPAVRAADGGRAGVHPDDIHQIAHAEPLPHQRHSCPVLGGCGRGRVEEQLGRVVAGLAVDLDQPGEVWGTGVVVPVVIAEPGALLGDSMPSNRSHIFRTTGRSAESATWTCATWWSATATPYSDTATTGAPRASALSSNGPITRSSWPPRPPPGVPPDRGAAGRRRGVEDRPG